MTMKKTIARAGLFAWLTHFLFAFTTLPGGEGFEVYMNGKLVLQRFGKDMDRPQLLRLGPADAGGEISIRYHHCGQTGKNRVLTVKNSQDRLLKEFRFADKSTATDMKCRTAEITALQKGKNEVLKLYYSSSELPGGRLLLTITGEGSATGKP